MIVEVGGRNDAGVVALALQDGKTQWQSVSSEAAYASPVTVMVDGQQRIVAPLRLKTVLLEPASGKVLTEFEFGRRGPSVVAATPLVDGSKVFLTASYGEGCRLIDFADSPPTNLWKDSQVVASQYATPLRMGDQLFAITGREDFNNAGLVCVRWEDGKELWSRPDFGTAHFIGASPHVLSQHVDGRIDLLENNPAAFRVLATCSLPEGTYRALPALSQGTLYCRRAQSPRRGELLAIELVKQD